MHWREFSACLQQKKVVHKAADKYGHTITTTVIYDVLYHVCETLLLHFASITKRVFCARSCVSWLFSARIFCVSVSIPTSVNDRVHIKIHVCMQGLSGDLICEALISQIQ